MKTVGVRALKQNASAVVADAAHGETVQITVRGRAVAHLVPVPEGGLSALVAAGRARPARRRIRDLGPALAPAPGQPSMSGVLDALRDAERY